MFGPPSTDRRLRKGVTRRREIGIAGALCQLQPLSTRPPTVALLRCRLDCGGAPSVRTPRSLFRGKGVGRGSCIHRCTNRPDAVVATAQGSPSMSAAVPIVSWTFVRSILVVTIAYRRDGSTSIETPQRNQRSHRADRGCRRAAPMERSVKTQKCGGAR